MDEIEISELKEALYDQYMMMTNLCIELEEEREASATAASEALTMILRLEREKAAEKMEASQYKRMAEEKMQHVEENMAELEDEMQEKEMEISFLRHQLDEYRQKMSMIGMNVHDIEEQREARNQIISEIPNLIRRNISMPIFRYSKIKDELANSPLSPMLSQRRITRCLSQINETELDKKDKLEMLLEKSDESIPEGSKSTQECCGSNAPSETNLSESKGSSSSASDVESNVVVVHDVFEVPESQSSCSNKIKEPKNKNILSSTESLFIPQADSCLKSESNTSKKGNCSKPFRKIPRSSSLSSDNDLDQIKKRLEKLEKEKNAKQSNTSSSEQHLKLLTDIYEQLMTLEKRMKAPEPQRNCTRKRKEDTTLDTIIEVKISYFYTNLC
jgi:serine/threonine-protein phosphatase 2B regulatory subunit